MTILQKQCLLRYFGFPVTTDGIDGPETQAGLRSFREEFGSEDLKLALMQNWKRPERDYWQDILYFKRNEPYIGCSCGKCGGFPVEPEETLMRLADRVRGHFGAPMIPTSTVRCANHNAAVGGVKNSRHLWGKAMDFKVTGHTSAEILAYVKRQPEVRYAYAVNARVVHMDID